MEKFTKLTSLDLRGNQLASLKGLEKLAQLRHLAIDVNPDVTKAQIAELHKALLNCRIYHTAKK